MSTRSAIIRLVVPGKTAGAKLARALSHTYAGIYCHFDGYESGVGKVLLDHYSDPAKVTALIDLGGISVLGERVDPIGKSHKFGKGEYGTTVAYHRDRGEEKDIYTGATVKEVEKQIGHNGYVYVFDGKEWTCNGVPLRKAITNAKKAGA